MRLVIDTSVMVGELLRKSGRARLADDRLELFIPDQMRGELSVELPRRVRALGSRRGINEASQRSLLDACDAAISAAVVVIDEAVYSALEGEARRRTLRDPRDWPVVACALTLGCGVWTNDNDFLGTGVPTWTTESLRLWLETQHSTSR